MSLCLTQCIHFSDDHPSSVAPFRPLESFPGIRGYLRSEQMEPFPGMRTNCLQTQSAAISSTIPPSPAGQLAGIFSMLVIVPKR
jgi:hypothetical protein